ncbi:DVUA0089 family protein [Hyphobacterium sp.]|uniref:DVUA0089 family protein n=1 Tax=Hyphobacterium sp. TaxID=2004662 RepID=UPI003BA91BFB
MRFMICLTAFAFASACAVAQEEGDALSGEVTSDQSRVVFPITLEAGEIVTIRTSSDENFDTMLAVRDPGGREIAQNDDASPATLQSQVIIQTETAGVYQAEITGYGGSTGSFNLHVESGVDFGLSDSAELISEEIVTIGGRDPVLAYDIDLEAEDIFVATTFALTSGLDTTLALSAPNGMVVSQNDDRGDGSLNSQIVYQAAAAGTYTIEIGTFSGDGQGDLVLSLAVDPDAELPFDFTSIAGERIAEFTGSIDDNQPSIDYPIELDAGQTLYAYADALSGDLDTLLRLRAPDGSPLAVNDDRGDGSLNSAIAHTAEVTGSYTLEMTRYDGTNSGGEFELNLSLVDRDTVLLLQELRERVITLSGEVLTIETEDFVVHYTLEGEDESSREYAESVGVALQEIYDTQVNQMGWVEPIRDSQGMYRAFIADAGGSLGVAYPVDVVFDNPNTADITETNAARAIFLIENDFVGLGKEASAHSLMRATATHEFNHVIQYGYDSEEALNWLYESTATWIEVATVGSDQDATDYVSSDFAAPNRCWTTDESGHTYSQWTLHQSIADVHGDSMIVRFWENAVDMDGFETMAAALREGGTTIPDVIERWRVQNFSLDYDLAPLFDATVEPRDRIYETGAWQTKGGLEQLGVDYIELDVREPVNVELEGDAALDVVALGVRSGEVHAMPLGQSGSVDPMEFETLWLMVFNRAMPAEPGECRGVGYGLSITPTQMATAETAYRFSARHFEPPVESEDEDD